jgi:hypothetical protein
VQFGEAQMKMPRITLAWVLPVVMVGLAQGSIWAARHPHPRGDVYWHSNFEMIFLGINAPVETAAILSYRLLGSWVGVFSGDVIYMALTAMLWYVVGRKLDSWGHTKTDGQGVFTVGKVFGNSLSILYGLYLLISISLHNVIFTNPANGNGGSSNYLGDVIRQTLWFLWSLLLILIPGMTVALSLRRRHPASLDL